MKTIKNEVKYYFVTNEKKYRKDFHFRLVWKSSFQYLFSSLIHSKKILIKIIIIIIIIKIKTKINIIIIVIIINFVIINKKIVFALSFKKNTKLDMKNTSIILKIEITITSLFLYFFFFFIMSNDIYFIS